jgi:formate dehydrogenase maturation protein FdhE
MQVELIDAARRVQGRLTTPWIETPTDVLAARLKSGQALLDFDQIVFEWNDVRLLIRQVTDILRRHEAVDSEASMALHAVGRSPELPQLMRTWFNRGDGVPAIDMLDEVFGWAARPYLQRVAEVLQQRVPLDGWGRRTCPICAAEPDFSLITTAGDRLLVCGRCHVRWPFHPITCPYCGNDDRTTIKSLATPDGLYRLMSCRACGRYIKALDGRKASRPLLPYFDQIATLPLDAAMATQG